MEPCRVCAMLIISCGITKVVVKRKYHAAHDTRHLFEKAGIELIVLENQIENYENQ
jgi:dCMP deaminase